MIKEESHKASKAFRGLICQLLEKDINLRLGNNLNEFVEHNFFKDFDWNNQIRLSDDFLKSIPSYDKN